MVTVPLVIVGETTIARGVTYMLEADSPNSD